MAWSLRDSSLTHIHTLDESLGQDCHQELCFCKDKSRDCLISRELGTKSWGFGTAASPPYRVENWGDHLRTVESPGGQGTSAQSDNVHLYTPQVSLAHLAAHMHPYLLQEDLCPWNTDFFLRATSDHSQLALTQSCSPGQGGRFEMHSPCAHREKGWMYMRRVINSNSSGQ